VTQRQLAEKCDEPGYYYYYYYYFKLIIIIFTLILNSQGMKKITLCNTKKYKNQ